MIGIGRPAGGAKVLSFDIENRPLSYWMPDRPTAEVTAIASCWTNDIGSMEVVLLGNQTLPEMLEAFVARYNEADLVTGHYVRRHDLPILNGALMEQGMPILSAKMVSDTKLDMIKKADIPATQEYLLELLEIPVQKYVMSQAKWREANRLTKKGLAETRARVSTDVIGHIAMRAEMLKRGLLGEPRVWDPNSKGKR